MTARLLSADDEPAFQRLLRAAYGDTYSYRDLYREGGLARLLASKRATLFGDFDGDGELFSHTAFLHKDPRGEYIESGMSLRNAWLRTPGRIADADTWPSLFEAIPRGCAYVHQNTTTLHPLAQRYASRYMRAAPTGFIADYAIGERLTGFDASDAPMQCLTMTTALDGAPTARDVQLPDTAWSPWITDRLRAWGRRVVAAPPRRSLEDLTLTLVEHNPDLSLRRRALDQRPCAEAISLDDDRPRTDLVHVPLDARAGVLPALFEADYVPVGVRPHATRPDEVIVQHLPPARIGSVVGALRAARVHGDEARRLLSDWVVRCDRTL
jgi:hypothetical protein